MRWRRRGSRALGYSLIVAALALAVSGCGHHRPRIRLHGYPDDVDLAEILQQIVDDPKAAKSYAPAVEWTRGGQKEKVADAHAALQPYRSAIKLAVVPPRDATPLDLRCDVDKLRCLHDRDGVRTAFFFEWRGSEPKKYLVLVRLESTPRP